jgi:hypothetical protein
MTPEERLALVAYVREPVTRPVPAGEVTLGAPPGLDVLRRAPRSLVDEADLETRRDVGAAALDVAAVHVLLSTALYHKNGLAMRVVRPCAFAVTSSETGGRGVRYLQDGRPVTPLATFTEAAAAGPSAFAQCLRLDDRARDPWLSPEEAWYWAEHRLSLRVIRGTLPAPLVPTSGSTAKGEQHAVAKMDAFSAALVALSLLRRKAPSGGSASSRMMDSASRTALDGALWPLTFDECARYVDALTEAQFDPFFEKEKGEEARTTFQSLCVSRVAEQFAANPDRAAYFAKRASAGQTAAKLFETHRLLCKAARDDARRAKKPRVDVSVHED